MARWNVYAWKLVTLVKMSAVTTTPAQVAPIRPPWLILLVAWLVPGGGHLLLGKRVRGLLVLATVLISFAIGALLRGPFFDIGTASDMLSKLIAYGGRIADIACGLPYWIATLAGYAPPDLATHSADYGSKFLVAAGLINILAIIDAYEIDKREKN